MNDAIVFVFPLVDFWCCFLMTIKHWYSLSTVVTVWCCWGLHMVEFCSGANYIIFWFIIAIVYWHDTVFIGDFWNCRSVDAVSLISSSYELIVSMECCIFLFSWHFVVFLFIFGDWRLTVVILKVSLIRAVKWYCWFSIVVFLCYSRVSLYWIWN